MTQGHAEAQVVILDQSSVIVTECRSAKRGSARRSLFEYIEAFYDTIRKHTAPGYKSPVQFRQVT
ncbi:hypothetical protein [Thalassoglobus neptunius]|uniref:hypothetical protein n=1 Tax=Thalassoglobus neptunius TaxID=1938619 RepID=UPI0011B83EF4|nr:hypothetical protein [Thalassoglobus neptunius]